MFMERKLDILAVSEPKTVEGGGEICFGGEESFSAGEEERKRGMICR